MMIGFAKIEGSKVITHCDTHILRNITSISSRRPLLGGSIFFAGGIAGGGLAFIDLLYLHEVLVILCISGLIAYAGFQIGRLTLLSRDLRGSELADAIWGHHKDLQIKRHEIADAVVKSGGGDVS